MTRPAADLVKVETVTTGTGTLTLGTVVTGYAAFPASADGLPVSYMIEHEDGTERESGVGTYTHSGTTLSRDLVTFSTNSGSLVSFSAGTKIVRLTALAHDVIPNHATADPGANDDITAGYIAGVATWLNTSTDTLWFCVDHTDGAAVWRPLDQLLTSIASLSMIADRIVYGTGTDTVALTPLSSFGRSLIADSTASIARTTLELGTLATASAINNDNWSGADLAVINGGTGASSASAARTNLGVDVAGTDNSTPVSLAGTPDYLTIAGQVITRNQVDLTTDVTGDLPVADGGTGASDASTARTNLGIAIGSDVQAFDADLVTLATEFTTAAATTAAALRLAEATNNGSNGVSLAGPTASGSERVATFQDVTGTVYVSSGTDVAVADGGTGASDASTARTNLGLAIGTDVQAFGVLLDDIADLSNPGAVRILFWDDGASIINWLTVGTGLAVAGTTISATGGGAGTVDTTGTPADNQIAVFTDADTLEGNAGLTWDGAALFINDGVLKIKEQAEADADVAGYGQLWVDTATPNVLMFTDDAGNDRVLAYAGGAFHDGCSDCVANEHINHTSVTLTAGTGLTGGGDISASRSFAVDGVLEDLDTLGPAAGDGEFIVATDAGVFAYESGATARASLGLTIGTNVAPVNNPAFTGTVTIPDGALAIADTSGLQTALDLKAPLASPTFTGTVTLPVNAIANTRLAQMAQSTFKMRAAGAGTGDPIDGTAAQAKTALAIAVADVSGAAPLASPTFTGTVTLPATVVVPDGAFAIADTSGLQTALDAKAPLASPTFTGTVTMPSIAPTEETVAGTHTLAAADRGKLKRYTGAGHTWTVPNIGVGEVAIENDGSGAITLTASGITLAGAASIPTGKSATLRWYNGGTKCKALVEA